MEYVLGIDSGGTNYRIMASDLEGNTLGYHVGAPANLHYLSEEELLFRVNESIDQCLGQFAGKRSDAKYLVCGSTGIDSAEDQERLEHCYKKLPEITCPLRLMNDAQLAHYTVTDGEGILIISGTGSIAFGVNKSGETARAGGWPLSILGDEGSGIWVTKKALRHLGRWFDGAIEAGPMIEYLVTGHEIDTRDKLIQVSMEGAKNPACFPPLGGMVNSAAKAGDYWACKILEDAGKELCCIIEDIVSALKLEQTEPDFVIGVWGSNIIKSEFVLNSFSEGIKVRYPKARIVLPQREAIDGAVDMALKLLKQ